MITKWIPLLASVLLVFGTQSGVADTVILKNGRQIENCQATRKGDAYVIKQNGMEFTVSAATVASVEAKPVIVPTAVPPTPPPNAVPQSDALPGASPASPSKPVSASFTAQTPRPPSSALSGLLLPRQDVPATLLPRVRQAFTPEQLAHFRDEIEEQFRKSDQFDLEREVARVMLDPRVPDALNPKWEYYAKWQRASYQPIIDAVRAARERRGNIYQQQKEKWILTDQITVPGNITNKDTLTIRYVAGQADGSVKKFIWGDDEDVVCLTGQVQIHAHQTLEIRPGAIVIAAAFLDEVNKGAAPEKMRRLLIDFFRENTDPGQWDYHINKAMQEHGFQKDQWFGHIIVLGIGGTFLARGKEEQPIVMVSESSTNETTPLDWHGPIYGTGVMDYCLVSDNMIIKNGGPQVAFARSFCDDNCVCHAGYGTIVANRFYRAFNGAVELTGAAEFYRNAVYCPWGGGVRADDYGPDKAFPAQIHDNLVYLNNIGIITNYVGRVTIHQNTIVPDPGFPFCIINESRTDVSAESNYYGTNDPVEIDNRIKDKRDDAKLGEVKFRPWLTSPDSDLDGLTDDEEQKLGTDPHCMDTDGDFCIDGLEVNQYKTDPLNQDTDNDGVPDGIEVFRKTDPLRGVGNGSPKVQ